MQHLVVLEVEVQERLHQLEQEIHQQPHQVKEIVEAVIVGQMDLLEAVAEQVQLVQLVDLRAGPVALVLIVA
jgi:predicted DNA-binding protein